MLNPAEKVAIGKRTHALCHECGMLVKLRGGKWPRHRTSVGSVCSGDERFGRASATSREAKMRGPLGGAFDNPADVVYIVRWSQAGRKASYPHEAKKAEFATERGARKRAADLSGWANNITLHWYAKSDPAKEHPLPIDFVRGNPPKRRSRLPIFIVGLTRQMRIHVAGPFEARARAEVSKAHWKTNSDYFRIAFTHARTEAEARRRAAAAWKVKEEK